MANSLVQTVLKLTIPGVPDIYQGSELWDLSMVDPDNRRPVDFALRPRLLAAVRDALGRDRAATMSELLAHWPDGRIKLAVTTELLDLRRRLPDLFADGSYAPIPVQGPDADAVCAFERRHGGTRILVIVARFPARRARQPLDPDTRIAWPDGTWRDVLTGRVATGGRVAELIDTLPVAVFEAA